MPVMTGSQGKEIDKESPEYIAAKERIAKVNEKVAKEGREHGYKKRAEHQKRFEEQRARHDAEIKAETNPELLKLDTDAVSPCPFCGSAMEFKGTKIPIDETGTYWETMWQLVCTGEDDCFFHTGIFVSKERREITYKFNKRAE